MTKKKPTLTNAVKQLVEASTQGRVTTSGAVTVEGSYQFGDNWERLEPKSHVYLRLKTTGKRNRWAGPKVTLGDLNRICDSLCVDPDEANCSPAGSGSHVTRLVLPAHVAQDLGF